MRFQVLADCKSSVYREHNIKRSERIIALVCDEIYWDGFEKEMTRHMKRNDARIIAGKEPFKLEIAVATDYRSRSLSQNAWMWEAHTLEANFLNGHVSNWTDNQKIQWRDESEITPGMVHEDYMEQYAPRGVVEIPSFLLDEMRNYGRILSIEDLGNGRLRLTMMKSSSFFNVREFCEFAHKVEDRMLSYGITFREAFIFLNLQERLLGIEKKAKDG